MRRETVEGPERRAARSPSRLGRRPRVGRDLLAAAALAACAAGCSHLPRLSMPWSRHPAPPPQPVHALVITGAAGAAAPFPQYWQRNTLVIDLQGISGSGHVVLTTPAGMTWPFRLALRVMPGSVGELDVRADQRWVIPVAKTGAKPVDLDLAPGLYSASTREISVAWAPVPAG